jgi:hypothetical protein
MNRSLNALSGDSGKFYLLHTAEPTGYLAETGDAASTAWDMAGAGDIMGGLSHFFKARPELILGVLGLLGGGALGGKKQGAWLGPLLAAVLGGGAYAWRNRDKIKEGIGSTARHAGDQAVAGARENWQRKSAEFYENETEKAIRGAGRGVWNVTKDAWSALGKPVRGATRSFLNMDSNVDYGKHPWLKGNQTPSKLPADPRFRRKKKVGRHSKLRKASEA